MNELKDAWYMVEKIIHQIWIGDFKMPLREAKLIKQLKELHPDYEHVLWTDNNVHLSALPDNVRTMYDYFYNRKDYVFCADLMRIFVVWAFGGFYLDVDFDVKTRLDPFFENEGCLFYHNDTDYTIPNNLICLKQNSPILDYCLKSVNEGCSWYGPSWFGITVKEFLKLPNEGNQERVKQALSPFNVDYYQYYKFETDYARHLSLYSWRPETWARLNNGEQL